AAATPMEEQPLDVAIGRAGEILAQLHRIAAILADDPTPERIVAVHDRAFSRRTSPGADHPRRERAEFPQEGLGVGLPVQIPFARVKRGPGAEFALERVEID